MKLRFAPSPTGRLHVGNARVALLNWLWARKAGGSFLLRLDDTDLERSTEAFAEGILEDLRWLGLDWDDFARQSERAARYEAAIERLKAAGRLYPCFETAEELELKRKLALKSGRPPIYDRAALALSAQQRAALEAEGRRPHWRFRLEHTAIEWEDAVRGPQHFEGAHLSDPVLLREDGRPLYTLTSVVDDIELGVTQVLRGEDHVANTAVQVQLFHQFQMFQILLSNSGNRNIVDVDFVFVDQVEQKVERSLINIELDHRLGSCIHERVTRFARV